MFGGGISSTCDIDVVDPGTGYGHHRKPNVGEARPRDRPRQVTLKQALTSPPTRFRLLKQTEYRNRIGLVNLYNQRATFSKRDR